MAVTFLDGLKVEGNSEFNDHLGINGDTNFATPINIACSTVSDNGTYQRYYYAKNNESFTLTLKQTVTSGVVRYNYSMVNGGTAYDDVYFLLGQPGAVSGPGWPPRAPKPRFWKLF